MAVPLAIGEVSAIPEWEVAGLLAHLQGVGALDFMVVVLEAEDPQEGVVLEVGDSQAVVAGAVVEEATGKNRR